jgi:hypothetical protein
VLTGARKFPEMGITPARELETPEQIEKGVRQLADVVSDATTDQEMSRDTAPAIDASAEQTAPDHAEH